MSRRGAGWLPGTMTHPATPGRLGHTSGDCYARASTYDDPTEDKNVGGTGAVLPEHDPIFEVAVAITVGTRTFVADRVAKRTEWPPYRRPVITYQSVDLVRVDRRPPVDQAAFKIVVLTTLPDPTQRIGCRRLIGQGETEEPILVLEHVPVSPDGAMRFRRLPGCLPSTGSHRTETESNGRAWSATPFHRSSDTRAERRLSYSCPMAIIKNYQSDRVLRRLTRGLASAGRSSTQKS